MRAFARPVIGEKNNHDRDAYCCQEITRLPIVIAVFARFATGFDASKTLLN